MNHVIAISSIIYLFSYYSINSDSDYSSHSLSDRVCCTFGIGLYGLTHPKQFFDSPQSHIQMRKRVNTICNNVHLSLGSIIMATKHIGYYIESNIHNQKREIIQKNTPTNIAFLKSFICISHGLFLKHNIKHNLFIYTKLSLSFKKYEMKVLKGYDHNNISNSAFCTNGFGAALGVHYKKNRKCGIFWEVQMKKFIPLEWDREENSRITPPKEFSTSIGFIVNMLKKHN